MSLEASVNPIVFDLTTASSTGPSKVSYKKDSEEDLWIRPPGSGWTRPNLHVLTGLGDEAEREGSFDVTVPPGQTFDVGIYPSGNGPLTTDPLPRWSLTVFCVLKNGRLRLITDESGSTGGTWHSHSVVTSVPTTIIAIGASRKPPIVDSAGIPSLESQDGRPTAQPTPLALNHSVQLNPLLPGNHYFFLVLVTDNLGNWDFRSTEFDTLKRKLTVRFPTIHIHNDGDSGTYGEGEFWFRVGQSSLGGFSILEDFHLPTQDIDDWSETDRPYSVGFAHLGLPTTVAPGQEKVFVSSWGTEHDGILEADEGAGFVDAWLSLPVGQGLETSTNNFINVNCPTTTVDSDFHYSVDVIWSVEYVP